MTAAQLIMLLALIVGLAVFRITRPKFLRWLPILLLITVTNELVIVPYIKATHLFNRNIVYNVYSFFDMGIWLYLFHKIFNQPKVSRVIAISSVLIFGWTFIELYQMGWHVLHADSLRFYEVVVIILGIYYLYTLMKKEYHSFFSDQNFWLCSAVIIYHSILFLTVTTLMESNYWGVREAHLVFGIFRDINNILYYSLICAAFLSIYYRHNKPISPREWSL